MDIHEKAVNTIRVLGMEAINSANSGHGGIVMGAAPIIYATYMNMRFDPSTPTWFNRDRFVLSAGHGSALLYATNHMFGFPIKREELATFRKLGSRLHGHPELKPEIGIEATTGPLGQGFAMAVGLAVAEKKLAATNKQVDHYTYCLVGDGCLQEGVSYEAANLAGLWKLNKLIVLYDSNDVQLDGATNMVDGEDVAMRFKAAGWHVLEVKDGMHFEALNKAIADAKSQAEKPTIIVAKTVIGHSTPSAGTAKAHGLILGAEELVNLRVQWGLEGDKFSVPSDVDQHFASLVKAKSGQGDDWTPWKAASKAFKVTSDGGSRALRDSGHLALQQIAKQSPKLFGANADISSTTKAFITGGSWWGHENPKGTDLACGVREFGMAAIVNGLALHGFTPYCSTFLAFSDYMRPAIRLSALMNLPVHYIFTHDGLGHAQDGPTHQGPEHLTSLRLIPNLDVFRPCDDAETAAVYEYIYNNNRPSVTVLSRGGEGLIRKGKSRGVDGYIFEGKDKPQAALIATGTEVNLALQAVEILEKEGVSVVVYSMPHKPVMMPEHKDLPGLVIEMGSPAWNTFGHSGAESEVRAVLGFTPEAIAGVVKASCIPQA
ncbi:MAG: transketolase [Firmicutes bacterium]|nr:transketolase [Bacillota bacterium]